MSKTISSQAPDITVIVGSGEEAQEFQCYSAILSSASPVLSAMLCGGMKEATTKCIKFPDKDPDGWAAFLRCIDPSNALHTRISCSGYFDDELREPYFDEVLNETNVRDLVPWFHELQIHTDYLDCCDLILGNQLRTDDETRFSGCAISLNDLLEILPFAHRYDLRGTRNQAEGQICHLLEMYDWGLGEQDVFGFSKVRHLVEILLQMENFAEDAGKMKLRHCTDLWNKLGSCMHLDLSIAFDQARDDTHGLSHIISHALGCQYQAMRLKLNDVLSILKGKEGPCHISIDGRHSIVGAEQDLLQEEGIVEAISEMVYNSSGRYFGISYCREYIYNEGRMSICLARRKLEASTSTCYEIDRLWIRVYETVRTPTISSDADLTVVVGNGAELEEFKCHTAILSFASRKLDELVSASSGCICLPQYRPSQWNDFYMWVSAHHMHRCLHEIDQFESVVPLFREFGMTKHLQCCESAICYDIEYWDEAFREQDEDDEQFQESDMNSVLRCLQLAVENDLMDARQGAEDVIKRWFDDGVVSMHQRFGAPDCKNPRGWLSPY